MRSQLLDGALAAAVAAVVYVWILTAVLNRGSCGFGQLDQNKGTRWDIAALPDVHYEYGGSCGCCGDVDHLDLSYTVFDKLADRHWGVIGLKYRPVPCDKPTYEKKTNGEGSRIMWLRDALVGEGVVRAFGEGG
ncbi:hypothetical protein BSKO_04017 [Bryopsis sp. KO-2023]|nr:hypothetical protein BSKO_04017 [Bryopsis sp. KO-2023]